MAGKQRYTAEQVAQALRETKGLVTYAARHLGCDPDTVVNYAKRYPTVREAQLQARAGIVDLAEAALYQAIGQGDVRAIIFALRTLGRDRGYVEKVEQEHSGTITQQHGGSLEIKAINYRHQIRALMPSEEDMAAYEKALEQRDGERPLPGGYPNRRTYAQAQAQAQADDQTQMPPAPPVRPQKPTRSAWDVALRGMLGEDDDDPPPLGRDLLSW